MLKTLTRYGFDPQTPSKVIMSTDGTSRPTDKQTDGNLKMFFFFFLILGNPKRVLPTERDIFVPLGIIILSLPAFSVINEEVKNSR